MNITAEQLARAMFEVERPQAAYHMEWHELYRPFKHKRLAKAAAIIAALDRIAHEQQVDGGK